MRVGAHVGSRSQQHEQFQVPRDGQEALEVREARPREVARLLLVHIPRHVQLRQAHLLH